MNKPRVHCQWVEHKSYEDVWKMQTQIHQDLVRRKLDQRNSRTEPVYLQPHHFLLCEHRHVFTLGKSGSMDHLLLSETELKEQSVEFFKINRGGDITYHGPGQITGYPILDLDEFFTDVHKYVRMIEEMIIIFLKRRGLEAIRMDGYTGVWLPPDEKSPFYRKICAIGVHLSRWVSMHGFAFNVNTDVSYFNRIIPCGIADEDKKVTSLSLELGEKFDLKVIGDELWVIFADLFNCEIVRNE